MAVERPRERIMWIHTPRVSGRAPSPLLGVERNGRSSSEERDLGFSYIHVGRSFLYRHTRRRWVNNVVIEVGVNPGGPRMG